MADDQDQRLARLREFADQQRRADHDADRGSLDRATDVMALYEDKAWIEDLPAPKRLVSRGRPVDPASFSRFSKWLAERVPIAGRTAYQLRDAHDLTTNYLRQAQINPSGERVVRPLKWMRKHDYADRIPEVWSRACDLAHGSPTEADVRKALSDWKHDNLPTAERTGSGKRGGRALAEHWIAEAERIMREYPDLFVPAFDQVVEKAHAILEDEQVAA